MFALHPPPHCPVHVSDPQPQEAGTSSSALFVSFATSAETTMVPTVNNKTAATIPNTIPSFIEIINFYKYIDFSLETDH